MTDSIDEFLSTAEENPSRCSVCRHEDISRDLATYVEAHRSGKTKLAPHRIYHDYLFPKYGQPRTTTTVRRHIRFCLGYTGV